MCIICTKQKDKLFPSKGTLKNCFDNNNHGAGFMYSYNNKVYIKKGFVTFDAFYNALESARKITGDDTPYVMHFRIATQGNDIQCTHPFPLSSKMDNLKKLKGTCNIGIAHNGIIQLTTDYKVKDYSDTMAFITEYLSLIIDSFDWYKNKSRCDLIEKLMDKSHNKLAFLDKYGHIKRLGDGWIEDKATGCFFSNSSYSYSRNNYYYGWDSWDDWDAYDCSKAPYRQYDMHTKKWVTKEWDAKAKKWVTKKDTEASEAREWDAKTKRWVTKKDAEASKAKASTTSTQTYSNWLNKYNSENKSKYSVNDFVATRKTECAPSNIKVTDKAPADYDISYWDNWKSKNGGYDFSTLYCPYTEEDNDYYCKDCNGKKDCCYYKMCMKA